MSLRGIFAVPVKEYGLSRAEEFGREPQTVVSDVTAVDVQVFVRGTEVTDLVFLDADFQNFVRKGEPVVCTRCRANRSCCRPRRAPKRKS